MEARETIPSHVDALLLERRFDAVRAIYRDMLERDARHMGVLRALARLERQCGDEVAACICLRAAADLDPGNLPVLTELASVLSEMGRKAEAGAVYRQVLMGAPGHVEAHFGLGFMARAQRNDAAAAAHFAAALETLRTATTADPGNLLLRVQLATALRETGEINGAAAIYQQVLAADSRIIQAHIGLAWLARHRGDHEAALAHIRCAADLNPADLAAQINLAKFLIAAEQTDEARTVYARVAAQATCQLSVRAALGGLARSWQDWSGALEQFRIALASDARNLGVRLEMGRTYCDLAQWTEAEVIFRSILADSPQNVDALVGLAECAKARNDEAAALTLLETAATLAPLDLKTKAEIRRLKTAQGILDWRTEVEEAVLIARSPGAALGDQIDAARTLVQYGLTEAASPLLSVIQTRAPAAAYQITMALRQIERMGLAQSMASGSAHPEPSENQLEVLRGFVEKPVPESNTLLLVFGGVNNRLWITFTLLQRILRNTGASVVYVRDLKQSWYTGGIVGLGHDIASSTEGFYSMAKRHGAGRILTVGNCVGCIAALRYGLSLGAEGVLGFHPRLRPEEDLDLPQKATLRVIRERLGRGHRNVLVEYRDALVRPKVTLVYGEQHSSDVANARRMSEVSTITAVPIARGSADCVRELLVMGLLEQTLQDFVAEAALSPATQSRIRAGVAAP